MTIESGARSDAASLETNWANGICMAILAVLILLTVNAISELSARQNYKAQLERQIRELQAGLLHSQGRGGELDESPASPATSVEAEQTLRILEARLIELEKITIFGELFWPRSFTESAGKIKYYNESWLVVVVYLLYPISQGSDQILALVLIWSGGIGALIGGLRRNRVKVIRGLFLGFSAGFVAFLLIKGGKHLFLIDAGASSFNFNPYSCALAGLLAGLFTERGFLLLSAVVELFVGRLEQALK